MEKTYTWDMADHIQTKEAVIEYLEAAIEEHDTELLLEVIGDIARSEGMAKIADEAGGNRERLSPSRSREENRSFVAIAHVLDVLGYRIQVLPKMM
ncbi:MAG: putative addiction module antidote protein [Spirochaetaceae bacterium]|jgi:probable addiction module antidote protein|nr:putative addiction module antidote protein [Spirochaetaceae bacterium]